MPEEMDVTVFRLDQWETQILGLCGSSAIPLCLHEQTQTSLPNFSGFSAKGEPHTMLCIFLIAFSCFIRILV